MKHTNKPRGSASLLCVISIASIILPFILFLNEILLNAGQVTHLQSEELEMEKEIQTIFSTISTKEPLLITNHAHIKFTKTNGIAKITAEANNSKSKLSKDAYSISTKSATWSHIPWRELIPIDKNNLIIGREQNNTGLSALTCSYYQITNTDDLHCIGNLKIDGLTMIAKDKNTNITATGTCKINLINASQRADLKIICNGSIEISNIEITNHESHTSLISNSTLNIGNINIAKDIGQDRCLSMHSKVSTRISNLAVERHIPNGDYSAFNQWPQHPQIGG